MKFDWIRSPTSYARIAGEVRIISESFVDVCNVYSENSRSLASKSDIRSEPTVPGTESILARRHWWRMRTLAMYDIHEDASSNDHAYLESSTNSLDPPIVLN